MFDSQSQHTMNPTVFYIALFPFIFLLWIRTLDPQETLEKVRQFKEKCIRFFAKKQAEKVVNSYYKGYEKKLTSEGYTKEVIKRVLNEQKQELIEKYSHRLYYRKLSEWQE